MALLPGVRVFIRDSIPPHNTLMSRRGRSLVERNDLCSGWFSPLASARLSWLERIYPYGPPEMLRFGYNGGVAGACIALPANWAGLITPPCAMVPFSHA